MSTFSGKYLGALPCTFFTIGFILAVILPSAGYSNYSCERGAASHFTYSEGKLVASVLQFVVTGVEGKGLHNVGPGPQELPVQLSHLKANRPHHKTNVVTIL